MADVPKTPSALGPGERRVELLRAIVRRGGTLVPTPSVDAVNGYDFGLLDADIAPDLAFLTAHDYLEARFVDRVSTCPRCASHHLNLREVCPSCGSAHHADEPLLHHFRCGYVGRISEFDSGDPDAPRTCPKCDRALRHLGTEYDRLGNTYQCRNCGTSFQDPPVLALCLACSQNTPSDELLHTEVHSYALTSLGSAAVRRGRLFESEGELLFISGLPVYRRSVMLELLRQESRRLARFEGMFSLLLVRFRPDVGDARAEEQVLETLTDTVRSCDLIGQLADHAFVACLPATSRKGARRLVQRFLAGMAGASVGFETDILEVTRPTDVIGELQAFLESG